MSERITLKKEAIDYVNSVKHLLTVGNYVEAMKKAVNIYFDQEAESVTIPEAVLGKEKASSIIAMIEKESLRDRILVADIPEIMRKALLNEFYSVCADEAMHYEWIEEQLLSLTTKEV